MQNESSHREKSPWRINTVGEQAVDKGGEEMSSIVSQIAAAVAVLALFATGLIVFPREGMKGLARGLAVTVSLAVIAAFLITAARTFGP